MGHAEPWANWIREGYFLSLIDQEIRKYYYVARRDFAHVKYTWEETIAAGGLSGPVTLANIEITMPWKHIHQLIFGIRPQVYIYVYIPTDMDRHGVPKTPRQTPTNRTIGHYTMWMSPWDQPCWVTEHFMQNPLVSNIAFACSNPNLISVVPELNFFINKLVVEHVGDQAADGTLTPSNTKRWTETLEKLYKGQIPHRPLTLFPIRAPATVVKG